MPGFNPGPGPKTIPLTPLLWAAFVVCTLTAGILGSVGQYGLMVSMIVLTLVAGIAAIIRSAEGI